MKTIQTPAMNHKDFQILDKKILYQGFYKVEKYKLQHRLFKGGMSPPFEREFINRYKVAAVLLFDPILNKVVLIEQFRIGALEDPVTPWLLEIVAGILTNEESIEALALHEVREEAGLEVQQLLPIYNYWVTPGGSQEHVSLFLAKVDAKQAGGIHGLPEEHEDIYVHVLNVEDAFAAVRQGRINNATTIIALQWLELNLEKIRTQLQI